MNLYGREKYIRSYTNEYISGKLLVNIVIYVNIYNKTISAETPLYLPELHG